MAQLSIQSDGGSFSVPVRGMSMLLNEHAYAIAPNGDITWRGPPLHGERTAPGQCSVSLLVFPMGAFNIKLGVKSLASVTAKGYTVKVVDGHLEFTRLSSAPAKRTRAESPAAAAAADDSAKRARTEVENVKLREQVGAALGVEVPEKMDWVKALELLGLATTTSIKAHTARMDLMQAELTRTRIELKSALALIEAGHRTNAELCLAVDEADGKLDARIKVLEARNA